MPQSSGNPSSASSPQPSSSLGANEWLVEEMRERYTADPGSVDATWVDYFTDGGGASSSSSSGNGSGANGSATDRAAPAKPEP
ncbi:MAG: hypothetical protein Q7J48_07140, partial [Nocardioides sp.]|nr:hypothetical protein [Nocardioides sp.]